MGYYEGEIGSLCGSNGNGFGGGWEGLIGLVLVAGLLGNGNGLGGIFGGGNRGGVAENYVLATDFANIERKLDGVNNGLCDGFYAMNTGMLNGFNGLQQTVMQGFHGVDNAVCTLGYNTQVGFNTLANQIASCCCDLKTMNLENRYINEKQTCDIVSAINAGNQRLVDIYTNDKIEALRAENTALKGRINDDYQADRIINKLSPCPSPAYIVPNPNCCYQYNVTQGCGCNGGF